MRRGEARLCLALQRLFLRCRPNLSRTHCLSGNDRKLRSHSSLFPLTPVALKPVPTCTRCASVGRLPARRAEEITRCPQRQQCSAHDVLCAPSGNDRERQDLFVGGREGGQCGLVCWCGCECGCGCVCVFVYRAGGGRWAGQRRASGGWSLQLVEASAHFGDGHFRPALSDLHRRTHRVAPKLMRSSRRKWESR